MAGKEFSLTPRQVDRVDTPNRQIRTKIPVPESVDLLQRLRKFEPESMSGQPPIVWHKAHKCAVHDNYGNRWLDFSSGVLVANAGHGRQEIVDAIVSMAQRPLLTSYCFANQARADLAERLVSLAPEGLDRAFILSTGSEATECAVKLSRSWGIKKGGHEKIVMVSFRNAFHGRTLGAQQIGGIPVLKEWIVNLDPAFLQVPFPDGFRCSDTNFNLFEKTLADNGIKPHQVCGVITETYQGAGADFLPVEYARQLRRWCSEHNVVLTFDEVQAGFGRCGRQWGFELYGVVPDLFCLGKGISSSLPVSALVGNSEVMNQFPAGSMTSTHTGNPVANAAAVASIDLILSEALVENAAKVGEVLQEECAKLGRKYASVGAHNGAGLVNAVQMVKPGTTDPDANLAWEVVRYSVEHGLMLFAPVGYGGASVKICPPLCITADQVREGMSIIDEAIERNRR